MKLPASSTWGNWPQRGPEDHPSRHRFLTLNVKWLESLFPVHARTTQKVPPYRLYTPLLLIFFKSLNCNLTPFLFLHQQACLCAWFFRENVNSDFLAGLSPPLSTFPAQQLTKLQLKVFVVFPLKDVRYQSRSLWFRKKGLTQASHLALSSLKTKLLSRRACGPASAVSLCCRAE